MIGILTYRAAKVKITARKLITASCKRKMKEQ